MNTELRYDSPDKKTRKLTTIIRNGNVVWECDDQKCVASMTPLIDKLQSGTDFPSPKTPVKKPSRLDYRNRGLTSLLYGDKI